MNDLGLLRFGTTPQLSRNAMARGVGNRLRSLGAPGNRARLRDVSMAGTVMVGFVIGLAQALGRAEAGTDNILYWHDTGNGLAYPAQWMISSSWWVYPPPLGQSLEFIHPIGFPAYLVASSVLLFAALAYVARGWSLPLVGLGFLGIAFPSPPTLILAQPFGWALLGNVQLLMAAAIVAGMRWPAAWAVPLLTKIGPGVGLLWFAVRHEWRNLSIALAATLAISAASFLLSPSDWANWLRFVASNLNSPMDSKVVATIAIPTVPIPFIVRAAMSGGLVIWGARTNRIWTVPVAAGWAIPALYMWSFLPIWLGVIGVRATPAAHSSRAAVIGDQGGNRVVPGLDGPQETRLRDALSAPAEGE